MHVIDLTGRRFGKWTIKYIASPDPFGKIRWHCECQCGRTSIVRVYDLRAGKSNGCKTCHKFKGYKDIPGYYWSQIRSGAQQRKLLFDLTIENAWLQLHLQNHKCALSGQMIDFASNFRMKNQQTASLDRIDSTLGYTNDNIQWVHKDINRMKWNFTDQRFIELCKLVAENYHAL